MNAQANHSKDLLIRDINAVKDQCVTAWSKLPEPHRSAMVEAAIALADAQRAAVLAGLRFTIPHFVPYLGPVAG